MSTPTLTAGVKATVLVDLLPKSSVRSRAITRDIVLVLGFALLTAAAAQVQFSLGFTPVPLTGQTFAVLLSGAALGMRRGPGPKLAIRMVFLPGWSDSLYRGPTGPGPVPSGQHSDRELNVSAEQLLDSSGSELCYRNQPNSVHDHGRPNPGQHRGSVQR